jgi:hypothetical protein
MAKKIDKFYKLGKGVTTMHEVLESYIGGTESPGVGTPTFDDTTPEFKAYKNAHDKARTTDPRHQEPDISIDQKTGQLYINKENKEKLINNRE